MSQGPASCCYEVPHARGCCSAREKASNGKASADEQKVGGGPAGRTCRMPLITAARSGRMSVREAARDRSSTTCGQQTIVIDQKRPAMDHYAIAAAPGSVDRRRLESSTSFEAPRLHVVDDLRASGCVRACLHVADHAAADARALCRAQQPAPPRPLLLAPVLQKGRSTAWVRVIDGEVTTNCRLAAGRLLTR